MVTLVVAAALHDGAGRVLVQRRPAGKAHAGLWEFPGGKVEQDEAPSAALVRELREELAIRVDPRALTPVSFAGDDDLLLLLYRCDRWDGVAAAQEGATLRWADRAALAELPMPPLDRGFPAALAR